jgi:cytochrome c peroxidase
MKTKLFLLSAMVAGTLTSCIKDEAETVVHNYSDEEFATVSKHLSLPMQVDDYNLALPDVLGAFPTNTNPKEATLGRVLFYDKRLSSNGEVNCATCHIPEKGFGDGEKFSKGVVEERTSRNSLALGAFPSFNAYYGFGGTRMFWDNRAGSVMEQAAETMKNPVEMGNTDLASVVDELLNEDYYRILFDKAFANQNWLTDEEKMLQALQTFVTSIGCFNTRYDKGLVDAKGQDTQDFSNFTQEENRGKSLFNTNCASCHSLRSTASFGGFTSITEANNGLDSDYEDEGVFSVSHNEADKGVFKTPMLRNIEITGPYMHDGRFSTLEEVVEHYSSGIKSHANLHPNLRDSNGHPKKLNLNEADKQALVAFLRTLTDDTSLMHSRYSDPFKG